MKSALTEGCHVGLFREFVGTACCTYGQSNTTIGGMLLMCRNTTMRVNGAWIKIHYVLCPKNI